MSRLLVTSALLLTFATAGAQTIEELERAAELTLAGVNLPSELGGTVTFQNCADCGYRTHRTTDATEFLTNGQALPLSEFLLVVEEIYERPGTPETEVLVTVYLDIATERVTRVALRY